MPVPDLPPLRDYSRSRAVLIGNWDYTFLERVPAAANSLRRMEHLLTGPWCGWPPDRVTVVANVPGPDNIPDRLVTAYADVDDVALFYFVGHGQIAPDDELCLGMTDSRPEANRRTSTSLRFGDVRSALLESRAATKIVILDCCYAGLVTTRTLGGGGDVLDHAQVAGVYTMAATRAYTTARYEEAQGLARPQTYFTKYLADVVERGMPGQPAWLRLDPLFKQVRDNLAADHRPVPESRAVDNAREFVFAYNAALPATQHDPEQELAQREAQVAALLDQVAAHERELARLRSRQAESPPATAGRREELREAIHEAEREASEAIRRLDQARDEAVTPVRSIAEPAPEPAPRGALRGLAIRVALVTVVLGGAIAGSVIASSGGNHAGAAGDGRPTASGGDHQTATGGAHPTATSAHPTASGGAANGDPANIVSVKASQWKLISFTQPPDSVAFAPDGKTLAVGTSEGGDTPSGSAYLVNIGTSAKTTVPNPQYLEGVAAVAFTRGGTLSIDEDGSLFSWNVAGHHLESQYPDPQNGSVTGMAAAPEGGVAVVEDSTGIYIWFPDTGNISRRYQESEQGIAAMAMSRDASTLVTADGDRMVYLWQTGNMGAGPDNHISLLNTSVTALAVGPGGKTVAISGGGNSTYLWNPSNNKLTTVTGPPLNTAVNSMTFSPNGALLAIGDNNGTTYLWDLATGKPLPAIKDPSTGSVASVAFGPSGTTLATAYSNGYVYLWRLAVTTG